ncbi:hypothetical protein ACHAWO_005219 [Cyclotella atomus]|uniref:Uncharacterized protein n=1 Tax=Cyclotella atomus TaxID=382360 RepID=A0ABD3MV20_9STRA
MVTVKQIILSAAFLSGAASFSINSNSRRGFLQSIAITSSSAAIVTPSIANASYGDSSNIKLPNYIEFLIEKNRQVDPNDLLYKGPDLELQLTKIGTAAARLPEISSLAAEKKWSAIQGIITGPLGTLLQNMNNLAQSKTSKDAAKSVKNDLNDIFAAVGKKDSAAVNKAADKAEKDLEKFVNTL